MPAGDPEAARHDISNALKLGDPGLADAAREAFTNGMALTFTVSACAVVVAAVIATLILRDRNPATVRPGPAPAEQRELAPGNPLDVPAGHPGRPLLRPRRDGF